MISYIKNSAQMGDPSKNKYRLSMILTGLICTILSVTIITFSARTELRARSSISLANLQSLRALLEQRVSEYVAPVIALRSFAIHNNGKFTLSEFDRFADTLHDQRPSLIAAQIAPDAVVKFTTRRDRNSQAIGHDLLADPKGRKHILETIEKGSTMLAGPVQLAQGGYAVIARMPIFLENNVSRTGIDNFYGFSTAIFDVQDVLKELTDMGSQLSIKGRHGLGADGEVFWGAPEVFQKQHVSVSVDIPNGQWIVAIPEPELSLADGNIAITIIICFISSFVALSFIRLRFTAGSEAQEQTDKLRESEGRFKDIAEVSGDWIWEMGPDLRFKFLSDLAFNVYQTRPQDFIGKTRLELAGVREPDENWLSHLDDLENRRPFRNFEYSFLKPSGELGYSRISGKPIFDKNGTFLGYRGTGTDVTVVVEAQKSATEALNQLQEAITAIGEGVVIFDKDDRLVMCNEKYREYFPKSSHMFVRGTPFEDIIREGAKAGEYALGGENVEEWVKRRAADHMKSDRSFERRQESGRWLKIVDKRLADGRSVGFRVDITSFKRAQEAAETANLAKSRFLSTMSHEIRTPLNAIIGLVELLERTGLDFHQQKMVSTTKASSYTLLSIVNDVLDFSKIEAGDLQLEHTPFSIYDVVEEVARILREGARVKGLGMRVYVSGDISEGFVGDPTRLRQILINLVGNAIKFTAAGEVVLSAVREGEPDAGRETIRIDVTDTGIGVAKEAVEAIFQPFVQAEASMTRQYGGTGLGLSICKRLAEAMGGELRVESVQGEGATFSLVVGLARSDAPPSGSPAMDLDGVDVLILSANRELAEMQAAYLRKCRASADVCTDPEEAVDLARGARERGRPYKVVVFGDTLMESAKSQAAERIRGLDGGDGVGFVSLEAEMQDAVVLVSPMGVIRGLNQAAERLFGRTRHDLVGTHFNIPFGFDEASTVDILHSSGTFTTCEVRAKTILQSGNNKIEVRLHDIAEDRARPDHGFVRVQTAPLLRADLLTAVAEAAGRLGARTGPVSAAGTPGDVPAMALPIDDAERQNRLVLVVEDNETNQLVLGQQLALFGYTAQFAGNGAEALEAARDRSYCLVLVDCHMPVMDGFEFAQRYRASGYRGAADVPIIAVTGNVVREEIDRCYSVGMNDFVAKPVELRKFDLMLQRWSKRHGQASAGSEPDSVSTGQSGDDRECEVITLDRSVAARFVGDNPETITLVFDLYETTIQEAVDQFERACQEKNFGDIKQICHRIKSASRTVGANEFADFLEGIERLSGETNWAIVDRALTRLKSLTLRRGLS